jgi:hypothetical protein
MSLALAKGYLPRPFSELDPLENDLILKNYD